MQITEKLSRTFVLSMAILAPQVWAQTTPSGSLTFQPAMPLPGVVLAPPMMQMPLAIPLFLVGNHFTSTLILVNDSTAATYADVTIRGTDGQVLASKRVNFTANSQRRLDLERLIGRTSSATIAGSVLITPSSKLMGPAIAATLAMTFRGSADPNYIDEEVFMPSEMGSQVLQGVSSPSDGSTLLAISSLTATPQRVRIDCLGEHGASSTKQIQLTAGQTLLTDACTTTTNRDDVDTLLERGSDQSFGATGFRITSDAMPGSFAAFALSPHRNSGDTFFTNVLFTDPKLANSSDSVFTGVPVGTSTLLPDGTYTPHLSLTNFSKTPIHIHTTFAETSREKPQVREVGSVTIAPESSQELALSNLDGAPGLQNSFVVHSDGAPGTVAVKFVSRSNSRLHEVELQAKDAKDIANAGGHPWSIEGETESTLLLFNHGDKPQVFTVSISGSESWQTDYTLAPMQTKAISVRQIIDDAVKDSRGRVLPKQVRTGQISWMVPDSTTVSGRLLQTDGSGAMARSFSCGYSGLLCGATTQLVQTYFPDGSVADFGSLTPTTCTSGSPNQCSGQPTGTGGSFNYSWNSANTGVAAISGSNVSSSVSLQGMAAGTSGISGMIRSMYCSSGGGGTATVLVPSSTRVVNTIVNQANSCNSVQGIAYAGWNRTVNRAVVDQTGADFKYSNQKLTEAVSVSSTANPLGVGQIITSPATTDPNGGFIDQFSFCSAYCPASTATSQATQTITDTFNGTYSLGPTAIGYSCNKVSLNGAYTP